MRSKGFTLAEILITLSILGVVAVITIPNIIQKQKERIYVTRLKLAYSILSNAAEQAIAIHRNDDWTKYGTFRKYMRKMETSILNFGKDLWGTWEKDRGRAPALGIQTNNLSSLVTQESS